MVKPEKKSKKKASASQKLTYKEVLVGEVWLCSGQSNMAFRVDELADSSVVLVVKFWAKKENYWQARYTMLEDIKYGFDEAGIRIPYPQMDVHLESGT